MIGVADADTLLLLRMLYFLFFLLPLFTFLHWFLHTQLLPGYKHDRLESYFNIMCTSSVFGNLIRDNKIRALRNLRVRRSIKSYVRMYVISCSCSFTSTFHAFTVVRVTRLVNGTPGFSDPQGSKTPEPIDIKLDLADNVGTSPHKQTLVYLPLPWRGAYAWSCHHRCLFFTQRYFLLSCAPAIFVFYGLKDVFSRHLRFLGCEQNIHANAKNSSSKQSYSSVSITLYHLYT